MKNPNSFQSRLGYTQIMDRANHLHLNMPKGYRIYNQLPKVWIGGSEDGSVFFYMERLPSYALQISGSLAESELNIRVFTRGRGQLYGEGMVGQNIGCELRGEMLSGFWLRVTFDDNCHYLLLLAGRDTDQVPALQAIALELAQQIRKEVPEAAALTW